MTCRRSAKWPRPGAGRLRTAKPKKMVKLLSANSWAGATLDDGSPLFHSSRGNIAGSGGALSVTTLGAARQAIRDTKGLDDVTPLNLVPSFLLVGSDNDTAGEQMLAALAAATTDDVNPFS